MKKFYSFLDSGFILHCPQPLQHLVNSSMASKNSGLITFYGAEDIMTLSECKVLKSQLKKGSEINGIIFFSINQFRYSGSFDFKLIGQILDQDLEVHFSRENISIKNKVDLNRMEPLIHFLDISMNRDTTMNFRKNLHREFYSKKLN